MQKPNKLDNNSNATSSVLISKGIYRKWNLTFWEKQSRHHLSEYSWKKGTG